MDNELFAESYAAGRDCLPLDFTGAETFAEIDALAQGHGDGLADSYPGAPWRGPVIDDGDDYSGHVSQRHTDAAAGGPQPTRFDAIRRRGGVEH